MHPRHTCPIRPLNVSLARFSSSLAIAAAMALAGSNPVDAAIVDWDPAGNLSNSGGVGPWNLTSAFWNNAGVDQLWNNANLDTARFGGTGGTVSLSTGITAGGLTFTVSGYTIAGNTLTLDAATPTISVAAGKTATVSSILDGFAGATVVGGGTLILTQANTISGLWDLQNGIVQANSLGALGGGPVEIGPLGTLQYNAGGGNLTTPITLNGGTWRQSSSAQLTTQAPITVNAASIIDIPLVNPGKIFVNAGINGTGNLTKNGNGILQIVQSNLGYTGNWTLNGGQIEAQNPTALGTGTVTVNGGELVASNNPIPNAVIIGTSAAILGFNNGNLGNYRGPITAAQNFSVGLRDFYNLGQSRSGEISGSISGTGAMNILNPSAQVSLTLSGNNAGWSGALVVPSNVQLRAAVGPNVNALGTGPLTVNGSLVLITSPNVAVGSDAGFSARYYNSPLIGSGIIGGFDFGLVTPYTPRIEPTINIPNGGGTFPDPPVPGLNQNNNGALWTGVLQITTGGDYTFFTSSDDGSLLYIDGRQIVQNDFAQGVTERSGNVTLSAGLHSIIAKFGQGIGGAGMQANYRGADTFDSEVLIGSIPDSVTTNGSTIIGTNTITTALDLGANGTGGFELAGTNTTVTGPLLLQNSLGLSVTGVTGSELLTQSGAVTLNGAHTFTLGINQVINGVQNGPAGADMLITGNIGEGVAGSSITKTGPRTLTLSGTNTYTGATTVINGVLQLNSPVPNSGVGPGGLVIDPTAGPVVVRLLSNEQLPNAAALSISSVGNNSALLDLNGFTETIGGFTATGTAASLTGARTGATGTLIVNGDLTFNNNRAATNNNGREVGITGTGTYAAAGPGVGTLNLGGAVRNVTVETTNVGPNIPGSDATIDVNIVNGGIIKLGSRTLILNGTNGTYAGGTVISAGIVRGVGANGASSAVFGTGPITMNGGSLELRNNGVGNNGIINYGNDLIINPSQTVVNFDVNNNGANTGNALSLGAVVIGSQTFNVTGGNSYSVRFSSATLTGNPIINPTTANLTLNNVGESGGSRSLTKPAGSTGVLILSGNGTYTGGTTVAAGSGPLRLVPTIGTTNKPAGTGAITLASGNTLQITPIISSLTSAGAVAGSLSAKFYNGATTIATGNYAAIPTASTTVSLLADGTFFNRPPGVTPASAINLLAVYSGLLNITTAGNYSFQTAVQDASQLVIDGVPVISVNATGGTQPLTDSAVSAPITLSSGFHTITMKAYNGAAAGGGFHVRYQGADTGGNLQIISPAKLFAAPALANVGNTGAPISLAAATNIIIDGLGSSLDGSISTLTLGAGSTLNATNSGGSGSLSVAGITTLLGAATLNPTTAVVVLTGDLADGGSNFAVSKTGVGALVLNGAKTFGGTLTISAGGVQVTNAASLGGTAGGTIVAAGATLDLNGTALGAEPLTLSGVGTGTAAAALYNSSSTLASAAGPISIAAAGTRIGGFGDLTLGGIVSGAAASDLTKTGLNTVTLNGVNTFSGTFTVSQGIVKLGNDSALGATSANTIVSAGATLDLNGRTIAEPLTISGVGLTNFGTANTLGALVNSSASPATASAAITLAAATSIGSSSLTGGGNITISGAIGGAFTLTKVGGNTVTLTAANGYTGASTVQLGTLVLSGAGTLGATANTTVNPTATLTLDNTGTNTALRLGTNKQLTLLGGNFNILGNAGAATVQDLGTAAFRIDSHHSVVTLTPGAGQNVRLTANTFQRNGLTAKGTALIRGTGLGTAAIGAAGIASVSFGTAPTPIGQTGAAGTLNRGILPWAIVDTTTTGTGSSFAAYSATNGLQALQAGEFSTTIVANNNIVATSALAAPGATTINSLTLKTGGSLAIGAGSAITLDSGGILATASASITGTGGLNAPANREIIVHTAGAGTVLNIATPITTTTVGLTKAGDGRLTLSAPNTFTGALRLNGGSTFLAGGANTVLFPVTAPPTFATVNSVPTLNTLIVDSGATLDLNGNDQRIGGLSTNAATGSNLPGTSGTITNTSATTANFRFARATANIVPTVIAGNLNIQRDGIDTIFLTSPSTYTGSTTLTGGVLALQDAGGLLNTSSLAIRRAVLRIDDTLLQVATRLNAAAPVALDGGGIVFQSRSGGTQDVLSLGAMTLNSGASLIQQNLGGGGTAATGTSTVNIASLARSQGATINFTAVANNNVQLGDNPRVLLGTGSPALSNGLVGGWATTQGFNSANPASGNNNFDFATYDPATGFRPTAYTAAFAVDANVNLEPNNSAGPASTFLPTGETMINALRLGGLGTTTSTTLTFTTPGDLLNLQSGGLLSTSNNNARFLGGTPDSGLLTAGGTASTGTRELFIHTAANTLTINAQIINNPNGAQVAVVLDALSQTGTVQFNGSNSYTGPTYVNGVKLDLMSTGTAIPGNLIINGGTANGGASQSAANQTVRLLAGNQIASTANVTVNGGGALDLNGFNNTIGNLTFAADGGGASNQGPTVQTGAGTLTLNGSITATNLIQATSISLLRGNLALSSGVHTVNVGAVAGAPGQTGLQINSDISGPGSLKMASGILGLGGPQNYPLLVTSAGTTNVTGSFTNGTSTVNANATTNFGASQTLGALNIGTVPLAPFDAADGDDIAAAGTTDINNSFTNGTLTVNANATTNFGASETLGTLNIGTSALASLGGAEGDDIAATAVVPEPGTLGLLVVGALGVLNRRRRESGKSVREK